MSKQMIEAKINMVYGSEFSERIVVDIDQFGVVRLKVNVHDMHQNAVRHFLNNIINLVRGSFVLTVVHGFNGGTVLKDMIWAESINNRIEQKLAVENNPGRTRLMVAAA